MLADVFERLRVQHGSQEGWWPAESPFEVMVGALLVQRTNWRNAATAIARLKRSGYLTAERLQRIEADALGALIKPAGFFRTKSIRLKKLAQFVVAAGGVDALRAQPTASLRQQLLDVPGIGPETADAMLGYAFDRPVLVVDAYARRLFTRLHCPSPTPSDASLKREVEATLGTTRALNVFHALIVTHGQRCCTPTPKCESCGLASICGYAQRTHPG